MDVVKAGLCGKHYQRKAKYGSVDVVKLGAKACGQQSFRWKGADVTYYTAHQRVAKIRGVARDQKCIDCGDVAAQWSYNHRDPNEMVDPINGCKFSGDPEQYEPRCRSCHGALDQRVRRAG